MLTKEQIKEIRNHLNKAQNPLFFFDDDVDGLCSFLLLARYIGKGKGVAVKTMPDLNRSYVRKIYQLNPDYVFILDKPKVSPAFIKDVKKLNLPIVWLDHHDVGDYDKIENYEGVHYYNPARTKKGVKKSTEPTTYWAWKISKREQDIWLAICGCVADYYLPSFKNKFKKKYPHLWKEKVKEPFEALYETDIGRIAMIMSFGLKDRTRNVVRMMKMLLKIKDPNEILRNDKLLRRYKEINRKYEKLIRRAENSVSEDKLILFEYGGEMSLSSDIANKLSYLFPNKSIAVCYKKKGKVNVSLRGDNIKDITLKAISDLENASGGGHRNATGAKLNVEDFPKFKKKIKDLSNKN